MTRHVIIALLTITLIGGSCAALAQTNSSLPSAGLTPSNFFYFFDRIGEKIQEFFTFNAQDKALLQLQFAAERMSEIKLELEVHGPEAAGVASARKELAGNIEKGNMILKSESEKGIDTRESENEFDSELQLLLQRASDEDSSGLSDEIDKLEQELSDDLADIQEEDIAKDLDSIKDIDVYEKPSQSKKSDR